MQRRSKRAAGITQDGWEEMQSVESTMELLPGIHEIRAAADVVYRSMPPTPQYRWPQIDLRAGRAVWVKHENHTPVGAFKIRGGLAYLDWLRGEVSAGSTVVASTRGNHGQSIAVAARLNGLRAVIVVPFGNSVEKNAAMRAQGAELIEHGQDFQEASEYSMQLARENGWHRIPSVHRKLVAGVATGTLELLTACPEIRTLYVPAGMGSGVCAAIAVRDGLGLGTEIVGVGSSLAPATALSLKAKRVVEAESTTRLADGVSCRKPDAGAVAAMGAGLARFVEVDEAGVAEAMRIYFADTHNVAEGAGAIGLAALLAEIRCGMCKDGAVGTVLCGGMSIQASLGVFWRVKPDDGCEVFEGPRSRTER